MLVTRNTKRRVKKNIFRFFFLNTEQIVDNWSRSWGRTRNSASWLTRAGAASNWSSSTTLPASQQYQQQNRATAPQLPITLMAVFWSRSRPFMATTGEKVRLRLWSTVIPTGTKPRDPLPTSTLFWGQKFTLLWGSRTEATEAALWGELGLG